MQVSTEDVNSPAQVPIKRSGGYSRRFTKEDETLLFRLYIQNRLAFGFKGSKDKGIMAFWQTIQVKFKAKTKKETLKQTIRERVEQAVRERIELLQTEETESEREKNDYTIALDEWVQVVQEQNKRNKDKKETAEVLARREEKIKTDRDNLCRRLGQKTNTRVFDDDDEEEVQCNNSPGTNRNHSPDIESLDFNDDLSQTTHRSKRRRYAAPRCGLGWVLPSPTQPIWVRVVGWAGL